MARNSGTLTLAQDVNVDWQASDLSVDMFIEEQVSKRCGFDIRYLHESYDDKYAVFHVVDKGSVATLYYWESRNEWFCKY